MHMPRRERLTRSRNRDAQVSALPQIDPAFRVLHSLYYQLLASQQSMLEDAQRTDGYRTAILRNRSDFEGRVVLDVGAGTGILSVFAGQAGARKVYACEQTSSAEYARMLVEGNNLAGTVEIIETPLQQLELPEKVDIIISEPLGPALFHEQMINVLLEARDRFLAPSGKIFPTTGRVWLAPFTDPTLYVHRYAKSAFWERKDFYGVDLRAASEVARLELFGMPVISNFDPAGLMASPTGYEIDFRTYELANLAEIELPFQFVAAEAGTIHGLAIWFDVTFEGSTERLVLSTAPDQPSTHWGQMRLVFAEPVVVAAGHELRGSIQLEANTESSYDVFLEAELVGGRSFSQVFLMQSYFVWAPETPAIGPGKS